jgi:hypothetical protein
MVPSHFSSVVNMLQWSPAYCGWVAMDKIDKVIMAFSPPVTLEKMRNKFQFSLSKIVNNVKG